MSRNFGLKKHVPKLVGTEDSAVAAWSLLGALCLTFLLLLAAALVS